MDGMNATQHCAAARTHSEDAVAQIAQAADKVSDGGRILMGLKDHLGMIISLIQGTRDDAISMSATHMIQVQEKVGSSTAGEIAQGYLMVKDMAGGDPITGLSNAVDQVEKLITTLVGVTGSLDSDAAQLNRLKDEVGTLASQLGA